MDVFEGLDAFEFDDHGIGHHEIEAMLANDGVEVPDFHGVLPQVPDTAALKLYA